MSTRENTQALREDEAVAWHALRFAERAIEALPADKRTYQLVRILDTIQQFRQQDGVRVQAIVAEFPAPVFVNKEAHDEIVAKLTGERNQALVDMGKVATSLASASDELAAQKHLLADANETIAARDAEIARLQDAADAANVARIAGESGPQLAGAGSN